MPLIDVGAPHVYDRYEGVPDLTPDQQSAAEAQQPSLSQIYGAAFRQGNLLGSLGSAQDANLTMDREPGFDAWNAIKGTKYEDHWNSFADIFNKHDLAARQNQIDMELHDQQTMAQSGWSGTVAGVIAGVADPSMLIPVVGEAAKARTALTIGKAALKTGASFGAITAAQELGLQASQETRTPAESGIAIGSSMLLGGLLGGAVKALSPAERVAGEAAVERLRAPGGPMPIPGQMADAGAAAAETASRTDLSIEGRAAAGLAEKTAALNPNLRLNVSPSVEARKIGQQLAENSLYQTMHTEGDSLGAAVETLMRTEMNGRLTRATELHDSAFLEGRQNGMDMSRQEFEDAIGQAMRRGDVGENDYVSKAAKAWRDQVFDPFKKQAIDAGLLPADVSVDTADSYFRRIWNTQRLIAQEPQFKNVAQNWFQDLLTKEHGEDVGRLQGRIAKLEQEKADLALPADQRTQTLRNLDEEMQQHYGNNASHVDRADQLNELRQKVADANTKGDKAAAKASQEAAAKLRKEGGKDFAAWLAKRSDLNARLRNVGLNYAGMAERQDTILGQLSDLAEANRRSMERLVKKGQVFQRDLQRLDPEKFAERVASLRESFAAEAQKAESQAERFKAQAAKLGERAKATGQSQGSEGAALLERQAKSEAARAERLDAIAARLERSEGMDPQAIMDEVQAGVDRMTDEVSNISLSRGEKAQRLQERLATLDPKKLDERAKTIEQMKKDFERRFYDKWEIERGGTADITGAKAPDVGQYTKDIVDAIYDKLTGRGFDNNIPDHIVPATRGPLKERTFSIPDHLVEDFLHDNIIHVGHDYARKMASEIELTKKFGSADLKDQFVKLQDEYRGLRAAVDKAGSVDEIRSILGRDPGFVKQVMEKLKEPDLEKVRGKAASFLTRREKADSEDIGALRDLLRGNYKKASMNTLYGRTAKGLLAFNYLRSMGGVAIANISEIFRPAMVYGLGTYMKEGIAPLLSEAGRAAKGMSVQEARLAGQAVERVLQHRIASMSEMGDPFARGTAIERLLDNGSKIASRWNLLTAWTDMMKGISSVMSQNRIIDAALTGNDTRTLAYLGMDKGMQARVADQARQFAEKQDSTWIANTEKWTDTEAVRAYRAAMSKDIDSVIVTRSVGDVPLFANTPTGKLILQFKSFSLASHQRVLLKGLQEGPTRFVSGMIAMTAVGMMATYLRALSSNRLENVKTLNPGWWIGEGLDNTGIFSVPLELANTAEKASGINPLKDPLRAFGSMVSGDMGKSSLRYQSRGKFGALLGPSAGGIEDLFSILGTAGGHALGEKVSPSQNKAAVDSAFRLTPFYSYPGLRQMLDWAVKPTIHQAVGAQ